jgi:hypothetical protein
VLSLENTPEYPYPYPYFRSPSSGVGTPKPLPPILETKGFRGIPLPPSQNPGVNKAAFIQRHTATALEVHTVMTVMIFKSHNYVV